MTRSKIGLKRHGTGDQPTFTPANQGHSPAPTPAAPTPAPAPVSRRPSPPQRTVVPPRAPDALIELSLSEETSMQALAEEAKRNPELAQAFQRAARSNNSSAQSLSQMVLAIGLSEARILAFTLGCVATLPEVLSEPELDTLIEGCLRRGALGERIAEETGESEVWPAYVVGFAAELGLLYITAGRPHLSQALLSLSRHPGAERVSAEWMMAGTDHGEAIAESPLGLALPEALRDALRDHHEPTASHLGQIVATTDRLAELVTAPAPLHRLSAAESAVASIGARSDVRGLLSHASSRVASLGSVLQLQVSRQIDPNSLLQPPAFDRPPFGGDVLSLGRGMTSISGAAPLAALVNRSRLQERIDRACTSGSLFSVIYLNFDQFRRINDTFGVPAGDQVMQSFAEGLHGCLNQPIDQLARIGGDTFAVFMPRTGDKLGQVTAERIRSMIQTKHVHLGGSTRVACSVTLFGMSIDNSEPPKTDGETVLTELAVGLEEARRRSRNRISWR
ncbi:MAG: diguanylate cyclase (GGDEF)-like protein [Myxococcota bacterium]|jgi:diguanylate cyclase (GGDEF)-like protein